MVVSGAHRAPMARPQAGDQARRLAAAKTLKSCGILFWLDIFALHGFILPAGFNLAG
jgi:hypothetical protein